MTKKLQNYMVGGLILTGLFGCVSPKTQTVKNDTESRQVAQASEEHALEVEFQYILNSSDTNTYALLKMDKLFTLLLKANGFVDQFSQELDAKLVYKKKNPTAVMPELSQSVAYKSLLKAWNLKERYTHEIEFLYTRALQVRTDLTTTEAMKQKTRSLLKAVTTYVKTSQNMKRVEFQPLLASLADIYKQHAITYKNTLKEQGNIKDVSAISEVAEYGNLVFSNPADLQAYAKVAETKEKSAVLLQQTKYKKASADVDADMKALEDPFDTRTPQALEQDLACKNGRKLCVSTGETGNMVGGVFPKGVWAFTYDDGPVPSFTSKIMDHFINYKDSQNPVGKATFFWTAVRFDPKVTSSAGIAANQEMIKKAVKHGFAIANHSYDHSDLNSAKTDRTKQIITSNKILEEAARKEDPSYKIQYFRCPYGSCYAPKIPAVRQMFVDQGQMHVYWRIDSLDWKFKNSAKASDLVKKQMEVYDHGIILMHDVQDTTPETTRIVLAWMKDQNDNKGKSHKMVTIPESVDLVNANAK